MSTKKAYEHEVEARLHEFEAEIERLKAKAENAQADALLMYQSELKKLEQRREEMLAKSNELKDASDNAWEDLKAGMEVAWEDMRKALKSAASRF